MVIWKKKRPPRGEEDEKKKKKKKRGMGGSGMDRRRAARGGDLEAKRVPLATAWKMIWRPLRISLQFFRGKLIGIGMFLPHRIVWYIVWYRLRPRFMLSILIAFLLISPYVSLLFSHCGMCRTPASVFPALPFLALPLWSQCCWII